MKRLLFSLIALFSISLAASAQVKAVQNVKISTPSVQCEMCKKRIEKAAYSVAGVKSAVWHQDHQDMHLIIDENKCSARTT